MGRKIQGNIFILFWFLIIPGCASEGQKAKIDLPQPNILFLIADDWSYPHAGIYGDPVVRTPTFDQLADDGALFTNAYCASPSCSPSRAAILTGRYPHQLGSGGNLWSVISGQYPNWVSILASNGYHTGMNQKGWGPGDFQAGGYQQNPAGQAHGSFVEFYDNKKDDQPFSFWFGSTDPHRPYEVNSGIRTGMNRDEVLLPGFLPDHDCVRNDILDYYFEVERFDRECGQILRFLAEKGELDNTLIIMTSDNGMPFPRAKANLYDYGTRMPLAISWKVKIREKQILDPFINFVDLAPTILEAAGLTKPDEFSGKSLLPLLEGQPYDQDYRDQVFIERERHANVRKGDLSYPMRGIRNSKYLYIRNMMPDRWPAGDPEVHQSVGQYGDVDNSISKFMVMQYPGRTGKIDHFNLTFGKRPGEELYDVQIDPYNLNNLVFDPAYHGTRDDLRVQLDEWMMTTNDLRYEDPRSIYWDTVRYTPEYQHSNFDLRQEIANYTMEVPAGYGRFIEQGCLDADD